MRTDFNPITTTCYQLCWVSCHRLRTRNKYSCWWQQYYDHSLRPLLCFTGHVKLFLDHRCTDDFIVIHRFPLTVTLFSCSIYCSFPVKFNFGCWLPLIKPYIELMLQRLCNSQLLQRSNGFFNWHILLKTF